MIREPKNNPLKWMVRGDDMPTSRFNRVPKSTQVTWLLSHPSVWIGYPVPSVIPGSGTHSERIFFLMQCAGLFSQRSQCNPITIERLVEAARASQLLNDRAVEWPDP